MRKNKENGKLREIWLWLVAIVVTGLLVTDFIAIYIQAADKNPAILKQKSLREENREDSDAFDHSKVLKKHSIRIL